MKTSPTNQKSCFGSRKVSKKRIRLTRRIVSKMGKCLKRVADQTKELSSRWENIREDSPTKC